MNIFGTFALLCIKMSQNKYSVLLSSCADYLIKNKQKTQLRHNVPGLNENRKWHWARKTEQDFGQCEAYWFLSLFQAWRRKQGCHKRSRWDWRQWDTSWISKLSKYFIEVEVPLGRHDPNTELTAHKMTYEGQKGFTWGNSTGRFLCFHQIISQNLKSTKRGIHQVLVTAYKP